MNLYKIKSICQQTEIVTKDPIPPSERSRRDEPNLGVPFCINPLLRICGSTIPQKMTIQKRHTWTGCVFSRAFQRWFRNVRSYLGFLANWFFTRLFLRSNPAVGEGMGASVLGRWCCWGEGLSGTGGSTTGGRFCRMLFLWLSRQKGGTCVRKMVKTWTNSYVGCH